jgi:MFS family permease
MDNAMSINKGIAWREFAPALVLVSNSLVWYALAYSMFNSLIGELRLGPFLNNVLFGAYYFAIAVSAILGGWLFPRARKTGLVSWMALGTVMSIVLLTVPTNSLLMNFLISVFFGVSIGIGLPSTLAYFADLTRIEKRGLLGGIAWSAVGFGILILAVLVIIAGTTLGLELLAIWRVIGLAFFLLLSKVKQEFGIVKRFEGYRQILARRDIILYLVPWIMFSIVNFAVTPILTKLFGDFSAFAGFVEFAITGVFALVGGILADRVGRKRIVITGFIILGFENALLSLFYSNPISWYIYVGLDGAAWGMFAAVFFMTLWGDLSEGFAREKYYVLGGLPYLLAGFIPILINPFVDSIEPYAAFSLASFFLFVAVLPLVYAPETLPEKTMKDRDLKSYLEKAEKLVQKEIGKNKKQGMEKTKKENEEAKEEAQESPEDEEARKLAEKYY